MNATLTHAWPTAPAIDESAARKRMQLAEGGPFLITDRSTMLALHWLVEPSLMDSLISGPISPALTFDRIDERLLVSLVVYRALSTRVAVGDRFSPWRVRETACESPWIAELHVAATIAHAGDSEPCFFVPAVFSLDPAAAWIRPDRYALRCRLASVERFEAADAISLRIADGKGAIEFRAVYATEPDVSQLDIPDAVGSQLSAEPALVYARHTLDRLVMVTSDRGIIRRAGLWRRPLASRVLETMRLDVHAPPVGFAPLASSEFIGAHECDAIDGLWIGRPQCAAGPACATSWREV